MSAKTSSPFLTGQHDNTKTDFELLDTLMKAVNARDFNEILPAAWALVSRCAAAAHEREARLDTAEPAVERPGKTQKFEVGRPEWGDCKMVEKIFGLSRSVIYRLKREKKITTCSLNEDESEPNSKSSQNVKPKRGKRLFELDSVANYLESLASGGIPEG